MTSRIVTLLLLASGIACESTPAGSTRDAAHSAREADAYMRLTDRSPTYRRLCQTRVRDGWVVTFEHITEPNVEYADVTPWPVLAVPDSGTPWIARDSAVALMDEAPPPSSVPQPPLDSAEAVQIAERIVGPTARTHCLIPLPAAGGDFVLMWGRCLLQRARSWADLQSASVRSGSSHRVDVLAADAQSGASIGLRSP
jgi:hypothetical protein